MRVRIGLIVMLCLVAAACARIYSTHGYVPTDEDLAQVITGKTTSEEVTTLIGPPTVDELLAGGAWYYVKSRFETYTYHEAKEIDREVVAISFDSSGRVSNVERFGLEKGRIVQISTRITGTGFDKVSTLRRIFGALGNFNAGQIIGDGNAPN